MKTSEELHHYISVCANIQTPDKGSRLPSDTLAAHYQMACRLLCLPPFYSPQIMLLTLLPTEHNSIGHLESTNQTPYITLPTLAHYP